MKTKHVLTGVFLFVLLHCQVSTADWVDNWIQQSQVKMPDSYETQQRGYVTGGNFSIRYRNEDVGAPVVSFSPPSVNVGCGGIDIHGGALGFLSNPDYLKQRLENIALSSVTAYTYDLALNLLCEPCQKAAKSLSNWATQINQLQMSDCQASKKLVAYIQKSSSSGEDKQQLQEVVNSTDKVENASTYYTRQLSADNMSEAERVEQIKALGNGCSDTFKKIFLTDGSMLVNIVKFILFGEENDEEENEDEEEEETEEDRKAKRYTRILKGFVGDIEIKDSFKYGRITPCAQNSSDLTNVIYGDMYLRDDTHGCIPATLNPGDDTDYNSIEEWIGQYLGNISQKIQTKDGGFTEHEDKFIKKMPLNILRIANAEINMMGSDFDSKIFAEKYAHICSLFYAHAMIEDLYQEIKVMLGAAIEVYSKERDKTDCKKNLSDKALDLVYELREEISDTQKLLSADLDKHLAVIYTKSTLIDQILAMEETAKKKTIQKISR